MVCAGRDPFLAARPTGNDNGLARTFPHGTIIAFHPRILEPKAHVTLREVGVVGPFSDITRAAPPVVLFDGLTKSEVRRAHDLSHR